MPTSNWTRSALEARLVRYADLRPCTTAFVDSRTPGSDRKENFTIIGPGVSENPEQHVHIAEPHGFNIGGARQPPGCRNSQHSHETPEIFVVHSGRWAFRSGVDGTDGEVVLEPGDTISLPTRAFRGFENVGDGTGFLFAVLGGDDPGRVTWAPAVFDLAAEHGLVLLENGALVDTVKGETVPAGVAPMRRTSDADVAALDRLDDAGMEAIVVRAGAVPDAPEAGIGGEGIVEAPVLGPANPAEPMPAAPLAAPLGFALRRLTLAPDAATAPQARAEEEVIMVQSGQLAFNWGDETLRLGPGDVLTVPKQLPHGFANPGREPAVAFVVRGADRPAAAA